MIKSARTSLAGFAVIISALGGVITALTDDNPATNPDWNAVSAAIVGGIGLIYARDNKVSDQAAGVRPEPPKDIR